MVRTAFRISYYSGIILLFVLIAIAGFTQTRSFRNYLHSVLMSEYPSVINGTLAMGAIEGNLITGFSIQNVRLIDRGIDLLQAEKVEVQYDPFGFFFKNVRISRVVVHRPVLLFYRSRDSTWNINRLIREVPADTARSTWSVDIRGAELKGASITIVDSVELAAQGRKPIPVTQVKRLNYYLVRLSGVELAASAQIQNGAAAVQVRKLHCVAVDPEFVLRDLTGEFFLSKKEARIRGVRIETAGSRLQFDASVRDKDVATIKDLKDLSGVPIALRLSADRLDTRELRQFLYPWVDFLDRSVSLVLSASGTVDLLSIEQLSVQTPRSYLRIEGAISNIHQPKDLRLDLYCSDNKINPQDLAEYLPGLSLPDLNYLGEVGISLGYAGRPQDFKASIDATTRVGSVKGEALIKLRNGQLIYDASLRHQGLNLGPITGEPDLESSLTGTLSLRGIGTDIRTLGATLKSELDSSEFYRLPLRRSIIIVDAFDGILRSRVSLRSASGEYELSGKLDLQKSDSAAYELGGRINSLDVSKLLRDPRFESDLSFGVTGGGCVRGKGDRTDSMSIQFARSSYARQGFDHGSMFAQFVSHDSTHRRLLLFSDAVDLALEGEFSPIPFIDIMRYGSELTVGSIYHRFRTLDSIRSFRKTAGSRPAYTARIPSGSGQVDVRFKVNIKDFLPIGVVALEPLFGAIQGSGTIAGSLENLRIAGSASVQELKIGGVRDSFEMRGGGVDFAFAGISRTTVTESLTGDVRFRSASMEYDNVRFDGPEGAMSLRGDTLTLAATSGIDSTCRVGASGRGVFKDGFLFTTFDTLSVGFDTYVYQNPEPVRIQVAHDGYFFESLRLEHNAEELAAFGHFNPAGISDCFVNVNGLLLNNVQTVLRRTAAATELRDLGGIVDATLKFRGSFDHPNIVLELSADGVRARNRVFGQINSRLSYFEHYLSMSVQFRSRPGDSLASPDLLLTGGLPYEFGLAKELPHELTGDVDVSFRSRGIDMEYLDPFIPEISNLTGTLTCDMRMRGPIAAPRYEGSLNVRNARFLFEPLGIEFQLDGDLAPNGERIDLQNVQIRNIPQDLADGAMKVSGSFTMLGLNFRDFDLRADGTLKVMKESFRAPDAKFYGDLVAQTGPSGLLWQGNLTHSLVKGEVYSRNTQLILPPDRETFALFNRNVTVTFVDDTARMVSVPQMPLSARSGAVEVPTAAARTGTPSFLDGIDYDLAIETRGPTQLRFLFNTQTSEELYADMSGRMYFVRNPTLHRLTGELQVGSSSYYNFLKKFNASGRILFTGDALNPELEITATYDGIHKKYSDSSAAGGSATADLANNGRDERVVVTLLIKGTRKEPKTKIDMEVTTPGSQNAQEKRADVESDAISFIVTGQFRDELSDQQRRSLIGANLGVGFASGVITGPLSDALRRNTKGYIQSVDVLYYGGTFEKSADVRLTGQVGEAVIRAGGRVLNDLTNTNVSVEFPISALTGSERLRNLILTLERRVEGLDNVNEQQRTSSNGARLFYRITF